MPPSALRESADRFATELLALCAAHPNFHFNVALPGYILERINPLLLSKLREVNKQGCLEWLLTGYTEPFFSFFPVSLVEENIRHGMKTFTELTGAAPSGFVPPFSNWEPSCIAALTGLGLNKVVLSSMALPPSARSSCGYWMTEHAGDAIALLPSHVLHYYSAPADLIDWLEKLISRGETTPAREKFVAVHYLVPLHAEVGVDPYRWLRYTVAELDKRILLYQTILMQQARYSPPAGLQYLPPCLPLHDDSEPYYFMNRLHSFDLVGIMQRKMMELCDRISALTDKRFSLQLKARLYHLQDINRYLPSRGCGFTSLADRSWSFGKMIAIERELREHEGLCGGKIRISDFLRNGNKSVIMSNSGLKAYIDHKNGGHIFELDLRERDINLCAAMNPVPHAPPDILSPEKSYTAFIDRIYPEHVSAADIIGGIALDTGDFAGQPFDYQVKKTPDSVKTVLTRQGSFLCGGKSFPLSMEKVFGLEKDAPAFSFVYQLTNLSLAPAGFTFAVELNFSVPGAADRSARLTSGKEVYPNFGWEFISCAAATRWGIDDLISGFRLQFVTQKPVDLYCLPILNNDRTPDPSCGVRLVLCSRVTLDQSSSWKLMGSMRFRKIRDRRKDSDAV
ncbi:MAG: DUF1926 domain-containing protein [Chitinispirillaceae bacterium]|nr:DUF1926 domain-containing protein [Chitinispirillaceae bacterium]